MREYFGTLEEESIRDNFVLVYELLDEVMDHGYPQISEVKVLKEYILQGANKLAPAKPPQAVTNQVSWRTEGIKYKKNEVFLDVIEKLNLLVAADGTVLFSEVRGPVFRRAATLPWRVCASEWRGVCLPSSAPRRAGCPVPA
jgi:AP-1 complex subunit mu